jgi:hypothetical protein
MRLLGAAGSDRALWLLVAAMLIVRLRPRSTQGNREWLLFSRSRDFLQLQGRVRFFDVSSLDIPAMP